MSVSTFLDCVPYISDPRTVEPEALAIPTVFLETVAEKTVGIASREESVTSSKNEGSPYSLLSNRYSLSYAPFTITHTDICNDIVYAIKYQFPFSVREEEVQATPFFDTENKSKRGVTLFIPNVVRDLDLEIEVYDGYVLPKWIQRSEKAANEYVVEVSGEYIKKSEVRSEKLEVENTENVAPDLRAGCSEIRNQKSEIKECHSERSEESKNEGLLDSSTMAQNDKTLPLVFDASTGGYVMVRTQEGEELFMLRSPQGVGPNYERVDYAWEIKEIKGVTPLFEREEKPKRGVTPFIPFIQSSDNISTHYIPLDWITVGAKIPHLSKQDVYSLFGSGVSLASGRVIMDRVWEERKARHAANAEPVEGQVALHLKQVRPWQWHRARYPVTVHTPMQVSYWDEAILAIGEKKLEVRREKLEIFEKASPTSNLYPLSSVKDGDVLAIKPAGWRWGRKEVREYAIVMVPKLNREGRAQFEKKGSEYLWYEGAVYDKKKLEMRNLPAGKAGKKLEIENVQNDNQKGRSVLPEQAQIILDQGEDKFAGVSNYGIDYVALCALTPGVRARARTPGVSAMRALRDHNAINPVLDARDLDPDEIFVSKNINEKLEIRNLPAGKAGKKLEEASEGVLDPCLPDRQASAQLHFAQDDSPMPESVIPEENRYIIRPSIWATPFGEWMFKTVALIMPAHAATVTSSIGTSSRDYSTITLWEAGVDGVLSDLQKGECYADSAFDEAVTINDSTTSTTNYLWLTVAVGERHNGVGNTGVTVTYSTSGTHVFTVSDDYFHAEWLDVHGWSGDSAEAFRVNNTGFVVRHSLMHDAIDTAGHADCVYTSTGSIDLTVSNCIMYTVPRTAVHNQGATSTDVFVYNITVVNAHSEDNGGGPETAYGGVGFNGTVTGSTMPIINSYVHTVQDETFETDATSGSYDGSANNASSDNTAQGSNPKYYVFPVQEFVSVALGKEDLRLRSDSRLISAGSDLGSVEASDVTGYDRDAGGVDWDIGADQYQLADLSVTEFVCAIGNGSAEDYNTLTLWEDAMDNAGNLTSSDIQVFSHSGITGTVSDGASVTGQTSSATATVIHATATQILLDSISGVFESGEIVQVSAGNSVTLSNAGASPALVAELYDDDGIFTERITIDGLGMDAVHNMTIRPASGEGHTGVAGTGVRFDPSTDGHIFLVSDDYVTIEGLAFTGWSGISSEAIRVDASGVLIDRCLFYDNDYGNGQEDAIYSTRDSATFEVRNSIFYNIQRSAVLLQDLDEALVLISNCTGYNLNTQEWNSGTNQVGGFGFDSVYNDNLLSNVVIRNTYADAYGSTVYAFQDGTGGAAGGDYLNCGNNASDDTTAPGSNALTEINDAYNFISLSKGNEDFHLKSKSELLNIGADLSNSFTNDIDDETRSAVFDIGADEQSNSWWDGDWTQRQQLFFDNSNSAEDLTNFPVLVVLNSARINYSQTQDNGEDLRFIDADGKTELAYEIEEWNETGASYVWVNVPFIDANLTTDSMFMYYGNVDASDNQSVEGTWNSDYVLIQHLDETSGTHYDSTYNNNDSTAISVTTQGSATGQINGADDFDDASSDDVSFGTSGLTTTAGTVSLWANLDATTGTRSYMFAHRTGSDDNRLYIREESNSLVMGFGDQFTCSTTYTITEDELHYYALAWGGNDWVAYADDSSVGSGTETGPTSIDGTCYIGTFQDASEWFDGIIDEVRISKIERSADWLEAEYKSMADDGFIMWGNTTPEVKTTSWWNDSWRKRQQLYFDNLSRSSNLTNFPALVVLNSSRIDYDDVQDNGEDIRFVDASGAELAYEIEEWDESGSSYIWVKVPQVDATSQTDYMFMYYDNLYAGDDQSESGVWYPDHTAVLHLNEAPADDGTFNDSSYNNYDGTSKNLEDGGGGDSGASARIAGGASMGGDDDYVDLGDQFDLGTDDFCVSFWINQTSANNKAYLAKGSWDGSGDFFMYDRNLAPYYSDFRSDDIDTWGDRYLRYTYSSITGTGWHHFVLMRHDQTLYGYLDGDYIDDFNLGTDYDFSNTHSWTLGACEDGAMYWVTATFDELRFANVWRSADFIEAQHQSDLDANFILWDSASVESAPDPTAIYYSVGTETGNLETGTATLTISGGVATFSEAQADNIGVGDQITYDGGSICFISGRTNSRVYSVITATGATPTDEASAVDVDSILRAFNSLSSAESGAGNASHLNTYDLTGSGTASYQLNLVCYADGVDTTACIIDGWGTDAARYLRIYTPTATTEVGVSQRHSGTWGDGYRITDQIVISTDAYQYVRFDGIALNSPNSGILIMDIDGAGEIQISNCFIRTYPESGDMESLGSWDNDGNFVVKVWNSIFIADSQDPDCDAIMLPEPNGEFYLYNTTAIANAGLAIYAENGAAYLKNCIAYSSASYAIAGTVTSSEYCYSNDNTAGSSNGCQSNVDFIFIDQDNEDYHLASHSPGVDQGADLSADLTNAITADIDGQSRPIGDAWDIGADEATTQIFYSVGTNTANLMNGSPTVDISDGIATFSVVQPDNVGVGDVVNIGSDLSCSIVGRIDSNDFFIRSLTGSGISDASGVTVNYIRRVFNGIVEAESGSDDLLGTTNLVTGNYQLNWPSYADGVDKSSSGAQGGVLIGTYTTGASNYIRWYTPTDSSEVGVSQRHTGIAGTGYTYAPQATPSEWPKVCQYSIDYIRFDGLDLDASNLTVVDMFYPLLNDYVVDPYDSEVRITNCLIHDAVMTGTSTEEIRGIALGYGTRAIVSNCIVYNLDNQCTGGAIAVGIAAYKSEATYYWYNNTVFGLNSDAGAVGGFFRSSGTVIAKNNYSGNHTSGVGDWDFYGTFATGSTNNASSDDTANSTNANTSGLTNGLENYDEYSNYFVSTTSGSEDFHLVPTASALIDAGYNLSTDGNVVVTTDIDGGARPYGADYDIGADEFGASGAATAVYYSVGTDTSDLKTTADTLYLTVSGSLVSFDEEQANNIGVGDVINIDNSLTVSIISRVNNYEYYIQSLTGSGISDVSADTQCYSIKRAFHSLSEAEDDTDDAAWLGTRYLTPSGNSAGYQVNWVCYNDGIDATSCTINSYYTGPNTYIRVYTPTDASEVGVSQRHTGTWGAGYKRSAIIESRARYIRFDGISFKGATSILYIVSVATQGDVRISNCFAHTTETTGNYKTYYVWNSNDIPLDIRIWNCIAINESSSASTASFGLYDDGSSLTNMYLYNLTGYTPAGAGIIRYDRGHMYMRNCISIADSGRAFEDSGTDTFDVEYCASSDGTADDWGGAGNLVDQDFVFLDQDNYDYHLASRSPGVDQGTDLSADLTLAFTSDIDGQTRPNGDAWDIGADEASVQIFYSVGTNTSNLAVGNPTVDISGGIATFSTAQPDNVGVGDVVNIGSDLSCSIVARIDSNDYYVRSLTGSGISDVSGATVNYIRRAFNSLSAAESGAAGSSFLNTLDLAANNYQLNFPCYADGIDTAAVIIGGWTTSNDAYIRIYTPTDTSEVGASQRHDGTAGSGYILRAAGSSAMIQIYAVVRIEGLELDGTSMVGANLRGVEYPSSTIWREGQASDQHYLQDNIIHDLHSNNSQAFGLAFLSGFDGGTFYISNNIVYDIDASDTDSVYVRGIAIGTDENSTYYIYNNTIYDIESINNTGGDTYGIEGDEESAVYLKNNYVGLVSDNQGSSDAFAYRGTFAVGSVNNMSFDDTANATNAATFNLTSGLENYDDYSTYFVSTTAGSEDLHLAPTAADLIDAGQNLSTDNNLVVMTDIDGATRPYGSDFDIGADEFGVSGAATAVYYSVGTDTSDLKTTADTLYLTVSGNLVSFDEEQATNIGVGDLINIGNDLTATIISRVNGYEYYVQSLTGSGVRDYSVDTQCHSIKRAFNSLSDAETNSSSSGWLGTSDLTASGSSSGYQLNWVCYADGTDTTVVDIADWSTGPNNYIRVYTPTDTNEVGVSQRHSGTWSATGYRLVVTGSTAITYGVDYVRLDGLQIKTVPTAGFTRCVTGSDTTGLGDFYMSNCLLTTDDQGQNTFIGGFFAGNTSAYKNAYIWNNIFYDFFGSSGYGTAGYNYTAYIYNNTAVNCRRGFWRNSGNHYFFNNIAQDCTAGFDGGSASVSDYNISDQGDAPNASFANGDATVIFVDAANDDYHLTSHSPGVDEGADLSSDVTLSFSTDIDGQTRPSGSAWDIGADEATTQIFYSVGTNTSDLKNGSPTVDISNGIATFSVAQPDNVGVGDIVALATGVDCMIVGRIDSDDYYIRSLTGSGISDVSGVTVTSIKRAFDSLDNAEQGADDSGFLDTYDLEANNYQLNFACYADDVDTDCASTAQGISITSAWTTGPSTYIRIFAPSKSSEVGVSQRHAGVAGTGYVYSPQVTASGTYFRVFSIETDYVRIEGIDVDGSRATIDSDRWSVPFFVGGKYVRVTGNLAHDFTSTGGWSLGVWAYGCEAAYIANNIFYNLSSVDPSSSTVEGIYTSNDATAYVYNNTLYNLYSEAGDVSGMAVGSGTTLCAKNNYVSYLSAPGGTATGFADTYDSASTHNASFDDTASTATGMSNGIIDLADYSSYFYLTTSGVLDLHLTPTASALIDAGQNLSTDGNFVVATDIDGATRPYGSDYDIGADEFGVSGAATAIYYSVGTDTSDLKTTADTLYLTVSGSLVSFDEEQADNIGVGDVINIDNSLTVSIVSRVNNYEYYIQSLTGSGISDVAADTQCHSIKRAFNRLYDATMESDEAAWLGTDDLTPSGSSSGYQLNWVLYADGIDTQGVTVDDNWVTGPNNYIRVYTPTASSEVGVSQRHTGTWGSGYRLQAQLDSRTEYIRFDGLALQQLTAQDVYEVSNISTGDVRFIDCYGEYRNTSTHDVFTQWNTLGNPVISYQNCIAVNTTTHGSGGGYAVSDAETTVYFYNCTAIVNAGRGFEVASGIGYAKNCLGYSDGVGAFDGTFALEEYNASNDGTAGGTGSITNQDFIFIDADNDDYHLASHSPGVDQGADLSSDVTLSFSTDIDGQTRAIGDAWDIGADEASRQIFYSVGTDTSDLKTGTPTITLTSNVATFDTAQADAVGVGDLITLDNSLTLAIVARTSDQEYTVRSLTGSGFTDIGSATNVASITRAFNSLSAAVDASPVGSSAASAAFLNETDLATAGYQLNFPCYADGDMDEQVRVEGWTTGAASYIRIYTPTETDEVGESQRHGGTAEEGFCLINSADAEVLILYEDYVRVEGLVVGDGTQDNGSIGVFAYTSINPSNHIVIAYNICDTIDYGINMFGENVRAYVYNNICQNGLTYGIYVNDCAYTYLYNNTVYNYTDTGIQVNSPRKCLAINNIAMANGTDMAGNYETGSTNNATSDSTAGDRGIGTSSLNSYSTYFHNSSSSAPDLHLKSTATDLIDLGTPLTTDGNLVVTDDIDQETRDNLPDIGADEYDSEYSSGVSSFFLLFD